MIRFASHPKSIRIIFITFNSSLPTNKMVNDDVDDDDDDDQTMILTMVKTLTTNE